MKVLALANGKTVSFNFEFGVIAVVTVAVIVNWCTVRSLPNMKLSQRNIILFQNTPHLGPLMFATRSFAVALQQNYIYIVIGYEHAFLCYYSYKALFIEIITVIPNEAAALLCVEGNIQTFTACKSGLFDYYCYYSLTNTVFLSLSLFLSFALLRMLL